MSLLATLSAAVKTWLYPRRYGLERWSYTLQRVSGVAVALYLIAHVVETGFIVGGPSVWTTPRFGDAKDVWTKTVEYLANPFFHAGLVVIGFLVFFHTVNGIRLFLAQFGWTLGKPHRPEYPYKPASFTGLEKLLFWLSILIAAASVVYAVDAFFGVLGR